MQPLFASQLRRPMHTLLKPSIAQLSPGLSAYHRASTRLRHAGFRKLHRRRQAAELSWRSYGTDGEVASPDLKNSEVGAIPPISTGRQARLTRYRRAQENGFQGTQAEYEIESRRHYRHFPEAAASITTLRLEEALSRNQFIRSQSERQAKTSNTWKGHVVFNGESLRKVIIHMGPKMPSFPMTEYACPYMLPGSYTLRLRKRDGSDHPYQLDLRDCIYKSWCRTLADLAARQGLIEPVESDGYIRSFDFEANVKAQYRMSFKPIPRQFYGYLRYAPEFKTQQISFQIYQGDLPDPSAGTVKGFFYIDRDGMMRFRDVERERDISWMAAGRKGGFSTAWSAEAIRRRYPNLWAHAVRLGHWRAD